MVSLCSIITSVFHLKCIHRLILEHLMVSSLPDSFTESYYSICFLIILFKSLSILNNFGVSFQARVKIFISAFCPMALQFFYYYYF